VIVVYFNSIPFAVGEQQGITIARKQLEVDETIPPGAIWIDLIDPPVEEDRKVEDFVGGPVPTKSDPDYTEPLEAHYAENGVRYTHASVLSEPDETPDITGVTFVMTPAVLVTVHYHPAGSFDLSGQKLCKSPPQVLLPDAVAVGLINTVLNRSAGALSKAGNNLDQIASVVLRAKEDQASATGSIQTRWTRLAGRARRSRTCARVW
jgi:magnesium transporter